jgi:Protein of unknown function (DUF2783)
MKTTPNIPDPDGFYEALLAATQGLSEMQSEAFLLRLVLLLANQLGDQRALLEAIAAARAMVETAPR